jgi:hypothetical protein
MASNLRNYLFINGYIIGLELYKNEQKVDYTIYG